MSPSSPKRTPLQQMRAQCRKHLLTLSLKSSADQSEINLIGVIPCTTWIAQVCSSLRFGCTVFTVLELQLNPILIDNQLKHARRGEVDAPAMKIPSVGTVKGWLQAKMVSESLVSVQCS